jgi:Lon protease-like protein
MARAHLAMDDLPTEFAVFPLAGALLLPRGRLPLNVFEPRYLAMVEDSLANGRMFGMIQPNEHAPRAENGASLYRIGCLGRLSHFSETDDGRFLITLSGITRFVVKRELAMHRGYRRVEADYAPFTQDLHTTPDLEPETRDQILDALEIYFRMKHIDANWEAVRSMPDHLLVVTLAMLCPFDTAEKQALLEAPTEHDRGGDLLALLRMAVHEADGMARPS